jgi:beta-glucosidase
VTVEYRESIYVGYRYYDTARMDVLFPFGHGLSYTTFAYRDLAIIQSGDQVTVKFKVKNTGNVPGKEITQLYVRDVLSSVFRPDKELKGFAKVELQPGEEAEITITLEQRAFAFYDIGSRSWVMEAGDFEILIGASSRDIRLTATLAMAAHGEATPLNREKLTAYYDVSAGCHFSQADFEALLGRPLPPNVKPQKGSYTMTTPLGDTVNSFVGRQLYKSIISLAAQTVKDTGNPVQGLIIGISIQEMPLRGLGDALGRSRVEGLLHMINGHFFKGLRTMIRSDSNQK